MYRFLVLCLSFFVANGFILRDKESLILVPTVAFRDETSKNWNVKNQGWYYEEDYIQAKIVEKSLEEILNKDFDFNRINLFAADGEKNKNVCIDNFNRTICTNTDDEGRIDNNFQFNETELNQLTRINDNNNQTKLLYQVSVPKKNIRLQNEIYLCDHQGYTFISDIDDTIKITGVTSTIDKLMNTFSGDFKAVQGMAEIYRFWQQKYQATFAYLTASPDQLYPFLREFLERENFPMGSFHMRHFTWFDKNFLSFFFSTNYIASKMNTIEMFLKNTSHRKLILLGDSFQKDPNIYANITMKYSDRIEKIFIRKYANDTNAQVQLEQIFQNIPRNKWSTFETGYDLPREIF